MQDFVLLNHDRAVPLPDDIDLSIISYTEACNSKFACYSSF